MANFHFTIAKGETTPSLIFCVHLSRGLGVIGCYPIETNGYTFYKNKGVETYLRIVFS